MIKINNLDVLFKQKQGELHAVDNVSLEIKTGEIFGIAGSSGAGKSTLLRTINRLETPTSGEMLIDGKNIVELKGSELRELRREIGMIFQHFNLAESKTVYENIAFPLKTAGKSKTEIEDRVNELLEVVGLTDKKEAYPTKLSGGQKQRVGIARALANNAKILLCDEPTSALDLETTSAILALLRDINEKFGVTIVIITHELEVIKSICHRVAIMNEGKVVEEGDVYKIFTAPKHDFTKQLLSYSEKFDIPEALVKNLNGNILRITYAGDNASEPILSNITKKYGTEFSILHGKIEYIRDLPLGILYVYIPTNVEKISKIVNYIANNTYSVEVFDVVAR